MKTLIQKIGALHRFLSVHLFYPLVLSTLLVFAFFFLRIRISGQLAFFSLIWNLFLAWLPYLFSIALSVIFLARRRWWLALLPAGMLWLAFLPNAFYILTDLIHITERYPLPIWYDAGLHAITAWTGTFLAVVSLHLVQGVVQAAAGKIIGWLFSIMIIAMSGFGVYLGRFLRWNSWDLLFEPAEILADSLRPLLDPFAHRGQIAFIAMFTGLFFVCYLTFAWLRPFQTTAVRPRLEA